jgi:hypothetical protein
LIIKYQPLIGTSSAGKDLGGTRSGNEVLSQFDISRAIDTKKFHLRALSLARCIQPKQARAIASDKVLQKAPEFWLVLDDLHLIAEPPLYAAWMTCSNACLCRCG